MWGAVQVCSKVVGAAVKTMALSLNKLVSAVKELPAGISLRKALSELSAFALQDSGKLALLVMHRHLARGGQKHTQAALLARVRCCPSRVAVLSDLALQFTQSSGTALSQCCVCRLLSHIFLCLLLLRIVLHFIRVVHISILFSNFTFFFSFKQYRDNSTLKDYILSAVFSQLIS